MKLFNLKLPNLLVYVLIALNSLNSAYCKSNNDEIEKLEEKNVRQMTFYIDSKDLFIYSAESQRDQLRVVGEIKLVEHYSLNKKGACIWYVKASVYEFSGDKEYAVSGLSPDLKLPFTLSPNVEGDYVCGEFPSRISDAYFSARRSIRSVLFTLVDDSFANTTENNSNKKVGAGDFVTAKFLGGEIDKNISALYALLNESKLLPMEEVLITDPSLSRVLLRHDVIYDHVTPSLKKIIIDENDKNPDVKIDQGNISLKKLGGTIKIPAISFKSTIYGRRIYLKNQKTLAAYVRDKYLFRNFNPFENKRVRLEDATHKVNQFSRLNSSLNDTPLDRVPYVKEGSFLFPADGFEVKIHSRSLQKMREKISDKTIFSNQNVIFLNDDLGWKTQSISTSKDELINGVNQTNEKYCPNEPMQSHFISRLLEMGVDDSELNLNSESLKGNLAPIVVFDRFPELQGKSKKMHEVKTAIFKRLEQSFGFSLPDEELRTQVYELAFTFHRKNNIDLSESKKLFNESFEELLSVDFAYAGSLPLKDMHPEFNDSPSSTLLTASYKREEYHGLNVASLIGAKCNSFGIFGVAEGSSIYAYDFSNNNYARILKDIVMHGNICHPFCIINSSIVVNECSNDTTNSTCMRKSTSENIQNLINKNYKDQIVLVSAAGKGRKVNIDQESPEGTKTQEIFKGEVICEGPNFPLPACFKRVNNRVTVTSGYIDEENGQSVRRIDPRVNFGSSSVDLIAPGKGGFGLVTLHNDFEGTSPATALVSGVLSILNSMGGDHKPLELVQRIKYTADLNEVSSNKVKFGWVNVSRAATQLNRDMLRLKGGQDQCVDLDFVEYPTKRKSNTQLLLFDKENQSINAEAMDSSRTRKIRHLVRLSYDNSTGRYSVVLRRKFNNEFNLDVYRNVSFYPDGQRSSYPIINKVISATKCGTKDRFEVDLDRVEELVVRADLKESLY